MYHGPVNGLIDWIKERHENIPFSMHMLGNMLIDFAAPDTALVETYVFVIQRYPAEARTAWCSSPAASKQSRCRGRPDGCARYVDRFERRDGEWRIGIAPSSTTRR
jgi:hypothetical protein